LQFLLVAYLHPNGCHIEGLIEGSTIFLGLGIVFACAAGFMGNRRWFWAALLPPISFVAGVAYSIHVASLAPCW
jgi:hypothetical protein